MINHRLLLLLEGELLKIYNLIAQVLSVVSNILPSHELNLLLVKGISPATTSNELLQCKMLI